MQDNDLLKPTLTDDNLLQPIYSVGALIAAGFFGGMLAVCIVAGENMRRQQRLRMDAIWLALAVIASFGLLYGVILYQINSSEIFDARTARLVNRAGGFVLAGGVYLLHRTAYRTQQFTGTDAPSPYSIVILAILINVGANTILVLVLRQLVETGVL